MEITAYGKMPDGTPINLYTLDNGRGLKAEITNYGGIVKRMVFTDKNGVETDVVLGYDTFEDYLENVNYYGAIIGRNSNRIAGAKFELNGKLYQVDPNDRGNNLHGGSKGFSKKVWQAEPAGTEEEPALILSRTSPDGEEGFPGNLEVKVTYTLTKDNGFFIQYEAMSDQDTVVNMTNHSYFNVKGHQSGPIHDQILETNCDFFTPNRSDSVTSGEVLSVTGTPFDFRTPKPIREGIFSDYPQVKMLGGYDHNFVIKGTGFRKAANLYCPENGISMDVYTDMPGMHIYTANGVESGRISKDGADYGSQHAICFETQFFPNALEYTHFPSPILRAGDTYRYATEFRFSIK